MDRQRSGFDDDVGQGGDAPGIEAPPAIGQDERRMHVRAYNFWAKLLDGRQFPSIESLDLDDMGDFGPHAVLLDFTSGIDNPAIGFLGEAVARECEIDDEIHYIADVPRRSLLSRLTDHYLQIIANRAPVGFEAEFVNHRGETILYRGVLLPFSSDDDAIDFILGVINWKQAAEQPLSDAITSQLTAVQPPPPLRPVLPVWGSGVPSELDDEEATDAMLSRPIRASEEPTVGFASFADDADAPLLLNQPAEDERGDDDDALMLDNPLPDDALTGEALADDALASADMALVDRLAAARESADIAAEAHVRGHSALYRAIDRAWSFAVAAGDAPEDYADLLAEAGIAESPRSPMTPVVKLVFGARLDKTRLAEYAAVLGYAREQAVAPGALAPLLARHDGGLKQLVREIRQAKRAATPAAHDPAEQASRVLDALPPVAIVALDGVDAPGDYVTLLARREADGTLAILGHAGEDEPGTLRMMRRLAKAARAD